MPVTTTLTETAIVAHLQAPMNLSMLDVAAWANAFSADFNLPQQTPLAPPFSLEPFPIQIPGAITFGTGLELPRLILRSTKSQFLVQLQSDRFGFSWVRNSDLGKEEDYAGYSLLKEMWSSHFSTFEVWFRACFHSSPIIRGAEIIYTNTIPLTKLDGSARRLSEVFRFVSPGSRPVNAFTASWAELLSKDSNSSRVSALTGVGVMPPAGQNVMFFNFTGTGLVEGDGGNDSFLTILDTLHDRITEVHKAAILAG